MRLVRAWLAYRCKHVAAADLMTKDRVGSEIKNCKKTFEGTSGGHPMFKTFSRFYLNGTENICCRRATTMSEKLVDSLSMLHIGNNPCRAYEFKGIQKIMNSLMVLFPLPCGYLGIDEVPCKN